MEEMPDLTGLTYDIARQRLGYLGIFLHAESNPCDDSPTIQISKQSIETGTEVAHGTIVEVALTDYDESINGLF
jgi:beta-lactam-binding protein with PASTA domain